MEIINNQPYFIDGKVHKKCWSCGDLVDEYKVKGVIIKKDEISEEKIILLCISCYKNI